MEEYYKNIAIVLKCLNVKNEADLNHIWKDLIKMFQEEQYNSKAFQELTKVAISFQKEFKAKHITTLQEKNYDKFAPALIDILNHFNIETQNLEKLLQSLKKYADNHSLNELSEYLNNPKAKTTVEEKAVVEEKKSELPKEQSIIKSEQHDNNIIDYRHKVITFVSYFYDFDNSAIQNEFNNPYIIDNINKCTSDINKLVNKTLKDLSLFDSFDAINTYMHDNFIREYHILIKDFIRSYLKENNTSDEDIEKYLEVENIEYKLNNNIKQMRLRDICLSLKSDLTIDSLKESILKNIDSLYERRIINLSSKLLNTLLTNTLESQDSLIDLYNELQAKENDQNIKKGRV